MEILKLIISNMATIATIIVLVVKLVEYIQKALKEKNWSVMLKMVMKYMAEAEDKFDNGANRKEWVLSMAKASAETINYDVDMDAISRLIDSLCSMSKKVNAPTETGEAGE